MTPAARGRPSGTFCRHEGERHTSDGRAAAWLLPSMASALPSAAARAGTERRAPPATRRAARGPPDAAGGRQLGTVEEIFHQRGVLADEDRVRGKQLRLNPAPQRVGQPGPLGVEGLLLEAMRADQADTGCEAQHEAAARLVLLDRLADLTLAAVADGERAERSQAAVPLSVPLQTTSNVATMKE